MSDLLTQQPINVITLTLLHPKQSTPVRSWSFEHEDVIRIGRSIKNHVVLYSAVVSRHHVELRRQNEIWTVTNLGTNGTYIEGQPVTNFPVRDGQVIHLAISGPQIQLKIHPSKREHQFTRMNQKHTQTQTINSSETHLQVSAISPASSSDIVLSPKSEDITVTEEE